MPQSSPRKSKSKGETMPPLIASDRIDSLLKEHLNIFPSKGELSPEEIEHWHRDLSPFPIAAIDWAFDNWRRNGRFFPVYGDILDQVVTWEPPASQSKYVPGCDAICKARHRRGYGEAAMYGLHDITRLNELIRRKIESENRTREQLLTDSEIESLYDELDKLRGSKPEWRA
jgi:hypothetical protein